MVWGIFGYLSAEGKDALGRQCSHDRLVEAINQARAVVEDQRNVTGLARLEAHSSARRNI
jgi:hypothetical protein